jgi:16S rRNA (uracil1498-N3)-methyltransferase
MHSSRIFVAQTLSLNDMVTLRDDRAHYLRNVLRVKVNQPCTLFNGEGGEYYGQIESVDRHRVTVCLISFVADDLLSPVSINLGIALTKNDVMDMAIQKSTELGVSRITPLSTQYSHTTRRGQDKKHGHWLHVIRGACEQCGRNRLPILDPITRLDTWLQVRADASLFGLPGAQHRVIDSPDDATSVRLLVGPEGGFNREEELLMQQAGYLGVNLGPRILRAETATVALMTQVQSRWGDM